MCTLKAKATTTCNAYLVLHTCLRWLHQAEDSKHVLQQQKVNSEETAHEEECHSEMGICTMEMSSGLQLHCKKNAINGNKIKIIMCFTNNCVRKMILICSLLKLEQNGYCHSCFCPEAFPFYLFSLWVNFPADKRHFLQNEKH